MKAGTPYSDIRNAWKALTGEDTSPGYLPKRVATLKAHFSRHSNFANLSKRSDAIDGRASASERDLHPVPQSSPSSATPLALPTRLPPLAACTQPHETLQHASHSYQQKHIDIKQRPLLSTQTSPPHTDIARDIARLDMGMARLETEMIYVRGMLEALRLCAPVSPAQDHAALDILANNVNSVSLKANEIDGLKVQIEILKSRVKRLEDEGARPAIALSPPYAPAMAIPPTQQQSRGANPAAIGPSLPMPVQALTNRASLLAMEPDVQPSGWTSVNPGSKRKTADSKEETRIDGLSASTDGHKRQKLAPLRNASSLEHVLNSSARQLEDVRQSPTRWSAPPIEPQNPPDAWHPVNEPIKVPRASYRGGSRIPRKATDFQEVEGTQLERSAWADIAASPSGFFNTLTPNSSTRRTSIKRRGSGGQLTSRVSSGPPDPVIGDRTDFRKKTRTKPIRNEEGILIRKDGKPDMRSVSSALNLKKVHDRKKEEDKDVTTAGSPTSSSAQQTGVPTSL